MADGMPTAEQLIELSLQDASDPKVQMKFLSYRVAVLTREKETIEARLRKLETAYTMGRGVFWALPMLGLIIGYLMSNWGWITRPWFPNRPSQ
jgi:hypothetical protein